MHKELTNARKLQIQNVKGYIEKLHEMNQISRNEELQFQLSNANSCKSLK